MTSRDEGTALRGELHRVALVCAVLGASAGCVPPPAVERVDTPLPSALGPAQNACEEREMFELVPSVVKTHSRDAVGTNTVRDTTAWMGGLAPYRRNGRGPIPLAKFLPQIGEPELARDHDAAVAPTRRKLRRERRLRKIFGVTMAVSSAVGAGLALDGLFQDRLGEAAVGGGIMVSGIITGLIGIVVAHRARPSADERIEYDIRTRILVAERDDLRAAARGVDRYNHQVRERCRASR